MLTSPGNTLADMPTNNILPGTQAYPSPVKLTHKINNRANGRNSGKENKDYGQFKCRFDDSPKRRE